MRIPTAIGAALGAVLIATGAALADTASPAPSPTPTASPAVQLHGVLSESLAFTSGVNATGSFDSSDGHDRSTRSNVSNAFVILSKTSGTFQFGLQGGAYSIPVVGIAGNKTIQSGANTDLFGPLPLAYGAYVPNTHVNVSAGVLATLIGAESTFTYQNWNIQRGAVWNVENAVERGVRASFTSGKAIATIGADDGFYSGKYGAAEASLTYAPDANDSALIVWLDPNSRTPGNATASIANKELLNLVLTRTTGRLQLASYVLYARSPAAASLGYTRAESAFGAALLANLTWSGKFSIAVRFETLHNASASGDTSLNADLVGYGPGSGIDTWTLTPAWQLGHGVFARADYSHAHVVGALPGLAFGATGDDRDQHRVMLEVGMQL